jgi:hypothetical protein
MLTNRQKYVLRWLDENTHTRSRWMRNGKAAYGDPEHWDTIEISGAGGSIRVKSDDWKGLRGLLWYPPASDNKMFAPNEKARALLNHQDAQSAALTPHREAGDE